MTDYLEMWICQLIGIGWLERKKIVDGIETLSERKITLEFLIKAILILNEKWKKTKSHNNPYIVIKPECVEVHLQKACTPFHIKKDREIESLEKALNFIYNQNKQ